MQLSDIELGLCSPDCLGCAHWGFPSDERESPNGDLSMCSESAVYDEAVLGLFVALLEKLTSSEKPSLGELL